jgi:hypothetical protein
MKHGEFLRVFGRKGKGERRKAKGGLGWSRGTPGEYADGAAGNSEVAQRRNREVQGFKLKDEQ